MNVTVGGVASGTGAMAARYVNHVAVGSRSSHTSVPAASTSLATAAVDDAQPISVFPLVRRSAEPANSAKRSAIW